MMKLLSSAPALTIASAAALSLTATPAMARHWHRDRGIDGGDVLAGVLIIGGIAAVAAAASKSNRDRSARDDRYPDYRSPDARYPQSRYPDDRRPSDDDYRDWRARQDQGGAYAVPGGRDDYPGDDYAGGDWRGAGDMEEAVEACVSEVERGNRQVDSVDGVNREARDWRIDGRLADGRAFSCVAGGDGRIRSATVDGQGII